MPLRKNLFGVVALVSCCFAFFAQAQQKGQPGNFDFYLMNLSWSPEFCAIRGTSPECKAHPDFILHGLWPQNNDGTYPVFCSDEPGPANPQQNLDITPDLRLLKHEWAKHGTCSGVSPQHFFAMERQAFYGLKIPTQIADLTHQISMQPDQILNLFTAANPAFPADSIVLSCGRNQLTAIEACFSKDLKPIACRNIRSCHATSVKVTPPGQ